MRKLIFILTLLASFLAVPALAQITLYQPDEDTIGWSAPVTYSSGEAIDPSDTVYYNVYLSQIPPVMEANKVANEITTTTYTLSIPSVDGVVYVVGVTAVRKVTDPEGITHTFESEPIWSNSTDPIAVPDGPFGWISYFTFNPITSLKRVLF